MARARLKTFWTIARQFAPTNNTYVIHRGARRPGLQVQFALNALFVLVSQTLFRVACDCTGRWR